MNFSKKDGITRTEANHLCNLANECIAEDRKIVYSISLVTTTVSLISAKEEKVISQGDSNLQVYKDCLGRIASANAFIAYMKEAIKHLDKITVPLPYEEYKKSHIKMERPKAPVAMEQEEYLRSEWSTEDQQLYWELQAAASTYGEAIHDRGPINIARDNVLEKVRKPYSTTGSGQDLIIYNYKPSVIVKDLEETFFNLQSLFRDNQKRLNQLKFRLKNETNRHNTQMMLNYQAQLRAYDEELARVDAEYQVENDKYLKEAASLKIVVPPNLMSIYNTLTNL